LDLQKFLIGPVILEHSMALSGTMSDHYF